MCVSVCACNHHPIRKLRTLEAQNIPRTLTLWPPPSPSLTLRVTADVQSVVRDGFYLSHVSHAWDHTLSPCLCLVAFSQGNSVSFIQAIIFHNLFFNIKN